MGGGSSRRPPAAYSGRIFTVPLLEKSYIASPTTFYDNTISSVKIPPGWEVELWEHGIGKGKSKIARGNITRPRLNELENKTTSFTVRKYHVPDATAYETEYPDECKEDCYKKKCDSKGLRFKLDNSRHKPYVCYSTLNRPNIVELKPLKIYSAGATKAKEELSNRNGLNIDTDGGHNLFFVSTSDYEKPENAYKIDKQCLNVPKARPLNTASIPGILDNAFDNRHRRMKAERYFTYPRLIIIENQSNLYSPDGIPKSYYLTYSYKTTKRSYNDIPIDVPLYYIRSYNKRKNDFSNILIVNTSGNIVSGNIKEYAGNNTALWIIENSSTKAFFDNNEEEYNNKSILLTSFGYKNLNNNPVKFNQSYDELGNSNEIVTSYINEVLEKPSQGTCTDNQCTLNWLYKSIAK